MFATPAFAQTAGAASDAGAAGSILSFAPLVLIFIAFYFLMIRPQSKRMKELQGAVAAVKKGDEVTTAGGIVGKVTKVEDQLVEIEIANGVKVKVVKSTLAGVAARGAKPAND
ncbi:MAG TPA: preprotein translocase subunit YajC [Sphingomonas sp.]|nr:preprotein translocase subunit YajC [Sphingomonas sp.]